MANRSQISSIDLRGNKKWNHRGKKRGITKEKEKGSIAIAWSHRRPEIWGAGNAWGRPRGRKRRASRGIPWWRRIWVARMSARKTRRRREKRLSRCPRTGRIESSNHPPHFRFSLFFRWRRGGAACGRASRGQAPSLILCRRNWASLRCVCCTKHPWEIQQRNCLLHTSDATMRIHA